MSEWVGRRQVVFDYIESFYNKTRRHSTLGGISPLAFENSGCVQTAAEAASMCLPLRSHSICSWGLWGSQSYGGIANNDITSGVII